MALFHRRACIALACAFALVAALQFVVHAERSDEIRTAIEDLPSAWAFMPVDAQEQKPPRHQPQDAPGAVKQEPSWAIPVSLEVLTDGLLLAQPASTPSFMDEMDYSNPSVPQGMGRGLRQRSTRTGGRAIRRGKRKVTAGRGRRST